MARVAVGPWGLALLAGAWLAGTAAQLQLPQTASLTLAAGMLAGGLAGCTLALMVQRRRVRVLLHAIGAALVAFALTDLRAQARLQEALAPGLEGRDLTLSGTVAGLPRVGVLGTQFEFEVASARLGDDPVSVPARISLGWYAGGDGDAASDRPVPRLLAGDRWQLSARLKAPHGMLNPHGLDLELWMFERALRASGSVRDEGRWLGATWVHPIDRARQTVRDAILRRVDDVRAAGVLAALAVGDQAAIERDDWEVFRVTGVAHLMSISGLHVTMFAWLAAAAIGRLWRSMPRALELWPAPDAGRWCGLLLAAAYALLAGWGVPAQRTVGMLAVVTVMRSLGWRWPWPLIWLCSGTAVSMLDPWALLQPGFWLSFVAVGLLMASDPASGRPARRGWRAAVTAGLRTQAVATAGLAPLSLVFFQQVSIVGALANLLAVPFVTLLVTPLALAGAVLPGLWQAGAWAVQALMAVLAWFASGRLAQWTAAAASAPAAAAGLAGGALLVMPLPWRLRALGLPLLLPLLAPLPERPPHGEVEIVAADIGQGTAVLVRTRDHLLLYDAGPRYSPESDAAGRVLLPLLRARGERNVDRLVLSHRDTDHTGGAERLLQGVGVVSTLSALEEEHPLLPQLPQHTRCEAGQHWSWDGVRFDVVHPLAADHGRGLPPNALSCVIRVSDRHGALLLLTGDIEAAQERELVARSAPGTLAVRFLMLPHHGSRTSSSPELLRAAAPELAFAQAAYRSRFGHPAPVVLARLRERGIALVRSDTCGAWQWRRRGSGPTWPVSAPTRLVSPASKGRGGEAGTCERDRRQRYWHHPHR